MKLVFTQFNEKISMVVNGLIKQVKNANEERFFSHFWFTIRIEKYLDTWTKLTTFSFHGESFFRWTCQVRTCPGIYPLALHTSVYTFAFDTLCHTHNVTMVVKNTILKARIYWKNLILNKYEVYVLGVCKLGFEYFKYPFNIKYCTG